MTPAEQTALLRDALEKLLSEANDGYATCPLTREQADTALAATAAQPVPTAEPMIDGYPLYSGIPQPEQTAGYVLMPVDCTDEIAEAISEESGIRCGGVIDTIYRKALAARPQVAQQSNAPALTTKLVEWAEEAVEYVNNPAMSPSLEREGRRLLAAQGGKP